MKTLIQIFMDNRGPIAVRRFFSNSGKTNQSEFDLVK